MKSKPSPLRGLAIGIVIALLIPATRTVAIKYIGIALCVLVGAALAVLVLVTPRSRK